MTTDASPSSSTSEVGDTMPYIVTTKRPEPCLVCVDPSCDAKSEESTRRAVATLDEARGLVWVEIRRPLKSVDHWPSQIPALTGESQSFGPLTDGTVIEVEPTDYHALWRCTPIGKRGGPFMELDGDEIVAAYNAAGGPDPSKVGTFSAGEAS